MQEIKVITFISLTTFFFGTLAGLMTIGVIFGGITFMIRGRFDRESVSRMMNFLRGNPFLSSAVFQENNERFGGNRSREPI